MTARLGSIVMCHRGNLDMLKEWIKKEANIARLIITAAASILILARIQWPDLKIDTVSIALFIVALLPWISSFIDSASLPGGWKFNFREIQKTVENQEKKLQDQNGLIQQQRKIIDDLVVFNMAWFLFDLLKGIYYAQKNNEEYSFNKNKSNTDNLLFLRNNGYIEIQGIRQLEHNSDIAKIVKLSPIGKSYVEIREKRSQELKEDKNT